MAALSSDKIRVLCVSDGVEDLGNSAVMGLVLEHSGAYGMGVDYAYTMVHGAPQRQLK